jgi:hypothetical protein
VIFVGELDGGGFDSGEGRLMGIGGIGGTTDTGFVRGGGHDAAVSLVRPPAGEITGGGVSSPSAALIAACGVGVGPRDGNCTCCGAGGVKPPAVVS